MPHLRALTLAAAVLTARPTDRLTAAVQCPDGSPPPCRAVPTRAATAPAPNSVAVLYFDNLSRDTADAYLADGLTEAIIVRLGRVERLSVKSRTAVRRYRGTALADPAVLGPALRVGHLVSGSVRSAGSRVRVTVELVRAVSGLRMWGDQYDRTDADLLAIEEDIARAIATAIAGRLLPRERASLATLATRNAPAYDHYLRGSYYLAQRTPRSISRAIDEYDAALRLDPGFTQALARLALAHAIVLEREAATSEDVLSRGFAAATQALAQDSTLSDAWTAQAVLLSIRHPDTFEGVVASFERALRVEPANAEAHHLYGWKLFQLRRDSAATEAFRRALAIEPGRPITLLQLSRLSHMGRRFDAARRLLDSALAADPGFYVAYERRALAWLHLGEPGEARADAETAIRLGAGSGRVRAEVVLALVEVHAGDTAAARARMVRVLAETTESERLTALQASVKAMALVALGEHDRALDLLEQVRPRGIRLGFELQWPELDALRSHPRFERLVEESRPARAPR